MNQPAMFPAGQKLATVTNTFPFCAVAMPTFQVPARNSVEYSYLKFMYCRCTNNNMDLINLWVLQNRPYYYLYNTWVNGRGICVIVTHTVR